MYPGSSDLAIDFLEKILKFNPEQRLSLNEALEHPYFKEVRNV